jgi:hypothetical protein
MEDSKLTPEELEAARDIDAYCWGSLDVSNEDVSSRVRELTPEGWARVQAVVQRRLEESRARERRHRRTLEAIERLRACANRRVAYVSKHSGKAVQSLWELPSMKSCQPIGAAS